MEGKIAKAKKYVKGVEKLRVVLLCISVVMLVYMYFGQKLWGELNWYTTSVQYMYGILSYLVLGIVAASFGKVFLVMYHNSLVKKL